MVFHSTTKQVCKEWFPKGTYKHQKNDGFPMSEILAEQIETLAKNVVKDWDFTVIITGQGEVRVGKSVLAFQIAIYWCYCMEKLHGIKVPFNVDNNIVLDGTRLIKQGNDLGTKYPYSPLVFDEAGADLEGRKIMQNVTQQVLDFYRECGQYNMLNILVLPEFFDLPKTIAVSRSILLLDVYYIINDENIFERGFFNFFSRRQKKKLYKYGKKEMDYYATKSNFSGQFIDFYPIDEAKYRQLKRDVLRNRENHSRSKYQIHRDALMYYLSAQYGLSYIKISQIIEELTGFPITSHSVSNGVSHYISKDDEDVTQ